MASSSRGAELGACPHCETAVTSGDVLISYGDATEPRHWAECPNCREVVDPTRSQSA